MGARTCDVYFNPACSKCRALRDLIDASGVEARYLHYLEEAPTRAALEALLAKLGSDDPRIMMRMSDALVRELGLADASRDALLDAIAAHPVLLERPIVVVGERAVVARPAERIWELMAKGAGK